MSKINLSDKHIKCIDKNCKNEAVMPHPILGVPLCKVHSQKKYIDALTDAFNHSKFKK